MTNYALVRRAVAAGQDAYDAATSAVVRGKASEAAYAAAWCGYCPGHSLPYTSPHHAAQHVAVYSLDAGLSSNWALRQIVEALYD